ncbi:GNAT family N-acetyltransferase [Sphingobium fuliginis]|jgi:GNAT superfamily N-acetyltransferase|uniref:GNAT family N-acetyltransferase n=1 Tax=Sphingobium fuliginis (strain ATCC 27551) TaxID=336203 RepID=A0A7M2GD96_SPHSA|nr:GNAT family N-acetyltransferase [Sphingobium fuliginis]QOT70670.1 GNAT family N-acetyltransferase [Sphingobium fuliginis]
MTDIFPETTVTSDAMPLTRDHLPQALALSRAVQWPYRAEDWAFAFDLGRGFGVEMNGRLVGTALWWPYGDDFATAGMIIVADEAQRRGIGARLMDALLADAAGRRIILNSTDEGQALYRKRGFTPFDNVIQHQAVLAETPELDPALPLRPATADDRATLMELDRAGAGMDRTNLLNALFAMADVLVIERDGAAAGYGCVRRWGRGVVIGPVIAPSDEDAKALIAALAARHVGDFVRIDVYRSGGLGPWIESLGLPQVGEVLCMALGAPPEARDGVRLYALSNQSLG